MDHLTREQCAGLRDLGYPQGNCHFYYTPSNNLWQRICVRRSDPLWLGRERSSAGIACPTLGEMVDWLEELEDIELRRPGEPGGEHVASGRTPGGAESFAASGSGFPEALCRLCAMIKPTVTGTDAQSARPRRIRTD